MWVCARPHHLVWGWALCVRVAFAFRGRLREQERERESHPKASSSFPDLFFENLCAIYPCHTCRVIYHSRPCNPRREGEGRWSSNDTRERTQDKRERRDSSLKKCPFRVQLRYSLSCPKNVGKPNIFFYCLCSGYIKRVIKRKTFLQNYKN